MVKQRRIIDALGKTYPAGSLVYLLKSATKASFLINDKHPNLVTELARF